jgi:RNase P protein component
VSKKVAGGTAVVRNRLRRQTFDVLASLTQSKTSYDIAVTLTKKYERSTDLEVDIKEALKGKLV